jgi:hypothetical protein
VPLGGDNYSWGDEEDLFCASWKSAFVIANLFVYFLEIFFISLERGVLCCHVSLLPVQSVSAHVHLLGSFS